MSKRRIEPEESIEPGLDGLANFLPAAPAEDPELSVLENWKESDGESAQLLETADEISDPVALVFGRTPESEALIKLAGACGFRTRQAIRENPASSLENGDIILSDLNNIVEDCNIERNTFVCIFASDETDCELILSQCLASDAYYIGLAGSSEKVGAVFSALKADGAPDTELAAIAAPMGLNVGAAQPDQHAVAIVAEMLAAKAGKLKRLRYGNRKL